MYTDVCLSPLFYCWDSQGKLLLIGAKPFLFVNLMYKEGHSVQKNEIIW